MFHRAPLHLSIYPRHPLIRRCHLRPEVLDDTIDWNHADGAFIALSLTVHSIRQRTNRSNKQKQGFDRLTILRTSDDEENDDAPWMNKPFPPK